MSLCSTLPDPTRGHYVLYSRAAPGHTSGHRPRQPVGRCRCRYKRIRLSGGLRTPRRGLGRPSPPRLVAGSARHSGSTHWCWGKVSLREGFHTHRGGRHGVPSQTRTGPRRDEKETVGDGGGTHRPWETVVCVSVFRCLPGKRVLTDHTHKLSGRGSPVPGELGVHCEVQGTSGFGEGCPKGLKTNFRFETTVEGRALPAPREDLRERLIDLVLRGRVPWTPWKCVRLCVGAWGLQWVSLLPGPFTSSEVRDRGGVWTNRRVYVDSLGSRKSPLRSLGLVSLLQVFLVLTP